MPAPAGLRQTARASRHAATACAYEGAAADRIGTASSGAKIVGMTSARREWVEHGALKLGALIAGNPDDPALLLLHGWPHSKEVYDEVLEELAGGHFVIALDLPGIGDSTGAVESSQKIALADILLGAAESLGGRAPIIVGFDVGGMIAHAAARDHAHRISGAVVINTVIPGIDPWAKVLADPRVWHFAFHAIPGLPEKLVHGHQREYFDFFLEMLVARKDRVSERHRACFAAAYSRPEALKAGFDWYRAMSADAERNAVPKEIDVPMLYLRGDADGGSPADYLPGLRNKGARHIEADTLPGSGEIAPLEAGDDLVRRLLSFAKSCFQPCHGPPGGPQPHRGMGTAGSGGVAPGAEFITARREPHSR
jgi:pimeloyl-ACP methyl ester carboxylesterase